VSTLPIDGIYIKPITRKWKYLTNEERSDKIGQYVRAARRGDYYAFIYCPHLIAYTQWLIFMRNARAGNAEFVGVFKNDEGQLWEYSASAPSTPPHKE
jgi:hypothetical protein